MEKLFQFILDEILKPILFVCFGIGVGFLLCVDMFSKEVGDLNVTIEQKPIKENCIQLFNSLN